MLTAKTGVETKAKLMELQTELIKAGCRARAVSPGKIIAELVQMEGAIEYLKKRFSQQSE